MAQGHPHWPRLLANARTFFEFAGESALKRDWDIQKLAAVVLGTGIELLLKARLAMEDPKLLIAGNQRATDRQLAEGEFRSVSIDECTRRLRKLSLCSLNQRQQHSLNTLRACRNRLAHHHDLGLSVDLQYIVATGLSLFVDIYTSEFGCDDPAEEAHIAELIGRLSRSDEFVEARFGDISDRLAVAVRPRTHHVDECSNCYQDAIVISDSDIVCQFCSRRVSIVGFAEEISEDGSVEICPMCGRRSVAKHEWGGNETSTHECFCCGWFTGPELTWAHWDGSKLPHLAR
jgi:hypothetical protein